MRSDDVDAATQAALRVLRGAAQTEVSLRRRLVTRGFTQGAARAATLAVAAHGYIDDAAFARSVAEHRLRGGYGRARVAVELRARGVGEAPIHDVLSAVGMDDERAGAARIATRLVDRDRARHGHDDPATARRVAAALARRGYDGQTIRGVLSSLWESVPVEE